MKIVLATGVFYPEPIAMSQIIKDIAVYLCNNGHTVTVLTPEPCRPYGYILPEVKDEDWWPFKRIILKSDINPESKIIGRYRENISFGKALVKYVNDNYRSIDVIYGNLFPLFCQRMVVKTAKRYNIPVVMHVEDIYPEPLIKMVPFFGKLIYRLLLPIDKYLLKNSAKVIAIAPKLREYLIQTRRLDAAKVDYVYNWQNEKRFIMDNERSIVHNKFTFMYCGSLSAAANLEYILDAFIKAGNKDSRLVFAGSGVMRETLEGFAAGKSNIEFWDAPNDMIGNIQKQADVLILPLLKDMALWAYPSKFPAYLFSAKPVIASVDIDSDIAETIKEEKFGWVVAPQDQSGLIELFNTVPLIKKDILLEMGRKSFDYSQRNLVTEINLSKIASAITSVNKM